MQDPTLTTLEELSAPIIVSVDNIPPESEKIRNANLNMQLDDNIMKLGDQIQIFNCKMA